MPEDDHLSEEEVNADPILKGLARDGLSLTRENYIIRSYGEIPDDWAAELEAELPDKLQDWSKVEE
ncbi:hypothetical protein [Altererythrobacter sp. TH136]|uniref:hypothetical protein n=1 Tax=Altererythrobacter sp. TH136 TaxID=2067415 RepID=UPI0011659882|nr:hypothetical protein [Altererythrobacter sp. TH136]QDM40648.1 hypothetical protein C0V74_06020 [Altererythrobacter sp. TH136]